MAEGGFDPSSSKIPQVCRYFIHGACHRGDSCRFLHDRTGTKPTNSVCKFYQQGNCSYGNKCRYDHVRAGGQNPKKTEQKRPEQKNPTRQQSRSTLGEDSPPSMVTLRKGGVEESIAKKKQSDKKKKKNDNWIRAKDFVPGEKFHAGATYARAIKKHDDCDETEATQEIPKQEPQEKDLLCPYFAHGSCPYGRECNYVHGEVCDICQFPRLHPTDKKQREDHTKECLKEMEKDLEHSFAVQQSKDKECCICLELVLEKAEKNEEGASKGACKSGFVDPSEIFGILENCTHCFCLSCIRRWRSDKSFERNLVRTCPICRVHSDFVTPSSMWIEDEEKKKNFIQDYKDALSVKPCHYFKKGKGECPFNEKCFYKHAYPDGTIAKPQPRKPRRRVDADGEMSAMEAISLWDFLERRDDGLISLEDELSLYLLGMFDDSDDNLWFSGNNSLDSDSDLGFVGLW